MTSTERSVISVHPHARGEHAVSAVIKRKSNWFIPTPVGNTVAMLRSSDTIAVHPHARGEHTNAVEMVYYARGSSPRPWGTPSKPLNPHSMLRFIPTPVGNTLLEPLSVSLESVHPHARGEHCIRRAND